MFICKNCGQPYSSYARFCGKCGGEVVETTQGQYDPYGQPSGPAYSSAPAPTYQPAYSTTPAPSGEGKTMGIIGMILGICGLAFSLFTFIASCAAIDSATSSYYYYSAEDDVVGAFIFSILMLAASIVGICLSSASRNKGFVCGITTTGKILSIIATAINGLAFFLAIVAAGNL